MKIKLICFVAFMAASAAFADRKMPTEVVTLFNFRLDPSFHQRNTPSLTGQVFLNRGLETMSIQVQGTPACLPNRVCAQMVRNVIDSGDLRITDERKGACNETILVAEKDMRRVDGVLETLTVVDNSTNTCKTMVALIPVEVTYQTAGYDRIEKRYFRTKSTFGGSRFSYIRQNSGR